MWSNWWTSARWLANLTRYFAPHYEIGQFLQTRLEMCFDSWFSVVRYILRYKWSFKKKFYSGIKLTLNNFRDSRQVISETEVVLNTLTLIQILETLWLAYHQTLRPSVLRFPHPNPSEDWKSRSRGIINSRFPLLFKLTSRVELKLRYFIM